MTGRWRLAAGFAVLASVALYGILLLPFYYRNFQFQRFLTHAVAEARQSSLEPDKLVTALVAKAAELRLPVRPDQVRLVRNRQNTGVEVRYFVRVDLPFYTVDLHFRPRAGS